MMRMVDIVVSGLVLLLASPVLLPVCVLVWWQDFHSPFYIAPRVGKGERMFRMVKLRSMVVNADKTGVDSTSANDRRITPLGHFIRRYKLDELTQMWNVLIGDMSLVGPRPNVKRETDLYTAEEKRLLTVQPGITDFASIVFADEGDILKDSADPDIDYNQLIRPWKSRLALITVDRRSIFMNLHICWLTALTILNRERALASVAATLEDLGVDGELVQVAHRKSPLRRAPPPGASELVTSR